MKIKSTTKDGHWNQKWPCQENRLIAPKNATIAPARIALMISFCCLFCGVALWPPLMSKGGLVAPYITAL